MKTCHFYRIERQGLLLQFSQQFRQTKKGKKKANPLERRGTAPWLTAAEQQNHTEARKRVGLHKNCTWLENKTKLQQSTKAATLIFTAALESESRQFLQT